MSPEPVFATAGTGHPRRPHRQARQSEVRIPVGLPAAAGSGGTVGDMISTPDEYLEHAPELGRPWLREFWAYVAAT